MTMFLLRHIPLRQTVPDRFIGRGARKIVSLPHGETAKATGNTPSFLPPTLKVFLEAAKNICFVPSYIASPVEGPSYSLAPRKHPEEGDAYK